MRRSVSAFLLCCDGSVPPAIIAWGCYGDRGHGDLGRVLGGDGQPVISQNLALRR